MDPDNLMFNNLSLWLHCASLSLEGYWSIAELWKESWSLDQGCSENFSIGNCGWAAWSLSFEVSQLHLKSTGVKCLKVQVPRRGDQSDLAWSPQARRGEGCLTGSLTKPADSGGWGGFPWGKSKCCFPERKKEEGNGSWADKNHRFFLHIHRT